MTDLKQQVILNQVSVANMTVWKRRLPSDDGFQFEASVRRPGPEWAPANRQDLVTIAARALTGNV